MENNQSATMHYQLHQDPPHILYSIGATNYIVLLDGRTMFDCGNGFTIPCPGCPCPDKLATANFLYFIHNHRRFLPAFLLGCAGIVLVNIGLMLTSKWDMGAAYIQSFSIVMNVTLATLAGLCFVAAAIFQFKKGLTVKWGAQDESVPLLSAGEISVAPDTLIMSHSETESPDEYRIRVENALLLAKNGEWAVVLPFRQSYGVIQMSSPIETLQRVCVFLRDRPEHDGGESITLEQAIAADNIYSRETWHDYMRYCADFAEGFKPWALSTKMTKGDPVKTLLRKMAVSILIGFVFVSSAFAQKSAQVKAYLGEYRYEKSVPTKGAEVSFIFEKAVLSRTADGVKNYAQILPAAPFYQDDKNEGKLIGITVGGDIITPIAPGGQKQTATKAAEVSAVEIPADAQGQSFFDRLPDSTDLQIMKAEHLKNKAAEWRAIRPVMDYYMWRFWGIMVILFGIGGAFWVLAKVSAKDSIKDLYGYAFLGNAITGMHIWSKTALFCLMAVPTLVILIDDAVRSYYTTVFGFWFVAKYAAIYWIWQYVFEKVLPNSPGQRTDSQGGLRAGNVPRLN